MSRKTFWFFGDFDTHTNEILSQNLPSENCHSQMLCRDGKKRDLWETDYKMVTEFKKAKREGQFTFTVYKRDDEFGPIRKYDFPTGKLRNQTEVKKAKAFIKERKK
jgi:hypothetical protein